MLPVVHVDVVDAVSDTCCFRRCCRSCMFMLLVLSVVHVDVADAVGGIC